MQCLEKKLSINSVIKCCVGLYFQ